MSARGWVARARVMIVVPLLLPRARYMSLALRNGRAQGRSSSRAQVQSVTLATRHCWSVIARPNRDEGINQRPSVTPGVGFSCVRASIDSVRGTWVNCPSTRRSTKSINSWSAQSEGDESLSGSEEAVLEKSTSAETGGDDGASRHHQQSVANHELVRDGEQEGVLTRQAWMERAEAHRQRVRALTDGSVDHDRTDPIFNFLFEYYHFKPRILLQWSPGINVYLLDADPTLKGSPLPKRGWEPGPTERGGGRYNPFVFSAKSRRALQWQRNFLVSSSARSPVYHCFGLHEWAMLYRPPGAEKDGRSMHQTLPLRVSQEEINAMVEGKGGSMACTHFDAFRFFAPEARPLNSATLSRETQVEDDQPGCVHANMDLFKWALRMWPLLPSESVIDALELAVSCRMLDMRASPYDLSAHGKAAYGGRGGGQVGSLPESSWDPSPVRIETEEGRKEYQRGQLDLYRRSIPIRQKLLKHMDSLLEAWAVQ